MQSENNKNSFTIAFKVYGRDGHRQGVSFGESTNWDWSSEHDGIRRIKELNSDITGTNEYTIVVITRNTEEEVRDEFEGQLSDGIFENYNYGRIEEVPVEDIKDLLEQLEEEHELS